MYIVLCTVKQQALYRKKISKISYFEEFDLEATEYNHCAKLKSFETPGGSPGRAWLMNMYKSSVADKLAKAYTQLIAKDKTRQVIA